jgi:hypothetical protein
VTVDDDWWAARRARVARLRQAMFRSLAEAQAGWEAALVDGGPNGFRWHGRSFRVDRLRGFIFPDVCDAGAHVVAPDGGDVDIFAGEFQREDIGELSRAWAALLGGYRSRSAWEIALAKFFNLAVVQPRVNPAFGPLFWLFLADDSGPGPMWDWSDNMFDRLGPMIFQLSEQPALVPSRADVRQAQIAFVESAWPGVTDPSCVGLSDADWATRCQTLMVQHQQMIDDRFLDRILERIDAEPEGRFD